MKKGDCVYCPSFIRLGYPECVFGVVLEVEEIGTHAEFRMCKVLWSNGTIGSVLAQFLIKTDKKP
tara:strand:+ start:833 stop:1027 length:195 start_codon:yes stop_codon:yes gene_type:complete